MTQITETKKISYVRLIWIRRNLGLGMTLLSMIIFLFYLSMVRPKFQATATIDISTSQDSAVLLSQEENLLRSHDFLLPIIRNLHLDERVEFFPEYDKLSMMRKLKNDLFPPKEWTIDPEERIYNQIQKELSVQKSTDTLRLSYISLSPFLARTIVNSIAQNYVRLPTQIITKKIQLLSDVPQHALTPHKYAFVKKSLFISIIIGFLSAAFAPLPPNKEETTA